MITKDETDKQLPPEARTAMTPTTSASFRSASRRSSGLSPSGARITSPARPASRDHSERRHDYRVGQAFVGLTPKEHATWLADDSDGLRLGNFGSRRALRRGAKALMGWPLAIRSSETRFFFGAGKAAS